MITDGAGYALTQVNAPACRWVQGFPIATAALPAREGSFDGGISRGI
jgi:hypothetical protein